MSASNRKQRSLQRGPMNNGKGTTIKAIIIIIGRTRRKQRQEEKITMLHQVLVKVNNQQPTPWSRERSSSQEIPAFYGTRRFITVFTRARHLSLSRAK
jgi:hypothetical protein